MSGPIHVTESELLAEIRRSIAPDDAPPDAMTTAELAAHFGVSRTLIKERLRKIDSEGRLEVYRVRRADATGRFQMTAAYVIKSAQREKQHKRPSRKREG